ncbi:MAG: hypothetical protein H0T73_13135 [Ardenticatenales bacterium]|nr:hypothetical protein [Ardenticatenales bacterium]
MNSQLFLRVLFALLSVIGSIWLTTMMPSGSAFATVQVSPTFDIWQGMILVSSFSIALFMARLLARS